MPLPRNWVEELIIEWLHLEGYLVEANFPVATTIAGGRGEVDVVGARVDEGSLDIIHIETGQLSRGKASIKSIEKKFRQEIRETLTGYFRGIFANEGEKVNYRKIYIPSYWTKPTMDGIRSIDIKVIPLPDFILDYVLPTIERWKSNPPHSPKARGPGIALPESHWLLKLLEHMNYHNLVKDR